MKIRQMSRQAVRVVVLAAFACAAIAPGAARAQAKDTVSNLAERAPGAKVTKGEAVASALKTLPGKVTDITVERKRGKQVYVIEIASERDGAETDVLVDMLTGAVLGIDR